MKVNQVSKWEGPLTRIKTWSEMCVFMFSNLLYQKLNTKRCILSKNQTVFHHRSTWTWSLNIDVLVDRRTWCFTSWSVVNTLRQVKSLFRFGPGLLIFLGHVAVWLWRAVQDLMVEKESSCLSSVQSHGCPALGSVATTLKPHKMEDFYVTDHEVDMK